MSDWADGVAGANGPGLLQGAGAAAAAGNPALAWFTAASPVLSKVLGPSNAGPSRVDSANSFGFDNSGFVVDFGAGSATSSKAEGIPPWLVAVAVGLVGLAGIVWIKKKT